MSGDLPLLPLHNFIASNMTTYHLPFEVVFCTLSNVLFCYKYNSMVRTYKGRTESHEQQFFSRELGTADEGE